MINGVDPKYTEYAEQIVAGQIVAGELIKLACKRYLSWFDRPEYEFKPEQASRPVNFIQHLTHWEGEFAGQKFRLTNWQKFLIYGMFGFYHKGTNIRVIHNAYIQISRKNGKTSLASALALYGLMGDGEAAAEIDFLAPSKEQIGIAFRAAANYAESINYNNIIKSLRNTIHFGKGRIRMMSPDAKLGDGFNPHFSIVDEYHGFKDNAGPDVLISGMGMRKRSMMIYITTSGFNLAGPCKEYRDMCEDILKGTKTDDSIFALIYELDTNDDWRDKAVWKKACPSLDITVTSSYMDQRVTEATNMPSKEVDVKTKNLNMWVSSSSVWLPHDVVKACMKPVDLEEFRGCTCVCGIDLATTSDLTVLSVMVSSYGSFYFKNYGFVPQKTFETTPNRWLYEKFKREGTLIITPGNVTDYDYIMNKVLEVNDICPVEHIFYDVYNSTQMMINLTEKGFECQPYSQRIGTMNKACKEIERLIIQGTHIAIDYSDMTLWCFDNAALKIDDNENQKVVKGSDRQHKIDVVVAMIMALGGYMSEPTYSYEIHIIE